MLFRVSALEASALTPGSSASTRFRFPEAGRVNRFVLVTDDGSVPNRAFLSLAIYRVDDRENWATDGDAVPAATLSLAEMGTDPNAGAWADLGLDVTQDEEWQITIANEASGGGAPTLKPRLILEFDSLNEVTP